MAAVIMSDVAYKEFKSFLEENDVKSNVIRIVLAGMGWSGPSFGIVLDEQTAEDVTEKIQDITFLVEGKLFQEFGGFTIKSPEENGLGGFTIEPNNQAEGDGCSTCGGGCH